jgi:hypothetical protein
LRQSSNCGWLKLHQPFRRLWTKAARIWRGALWWWLPKWQVNLLEILDAKARADVEDNFRKTIGQLLGGAAVLIGTGFAYYQSQLAQQATHDQLKATYYTFRRATVGMIEAMAGSQTAHSKNRLFVLR